MKKTHPSMTFASSALASTLGSKTNTKADTDAFYAVKPLSIRCCSTVENFSANKDISAIPLDDFVQKNGLKEYTTTNKVSAEQLKAVWTDQTFQNHLSLNSKQNYLTHTIPINLLW